MEEFSALLILIIGFIAGGYGTIVGAGGGFIFVPSLLIFMNMEPIMAAASGLVIVFINSCTGMVGYARQKKVLFKIAFLVGLSAFPGSILGVWLLQAYSIEYFHLIFSIILVGIGTFLFYKNSLFGKKASIKQNTNATAKHSKKYSTLFFLPLGLIIGVLSSYLGIGGGWLLVPILVYLYKIPVHYAVPTAIASLCLYSSVGVVSHLYYNNIDWITVLSGGVGVIIGASVGVRLSQRLTGKVVLQML